jgi:hypothetical protein
MAAGPDPKRTYADPGRRLGHGARRFGQAMFGPLLHTGRTLWLEVSGLFFALFALFFAQSVFKLRGAWRGGPEHGHLLLYLSLAVLFVWFSASSFLRARRSGKRVRG